MSNAATNAPADSLTLRDLLALGRAGKPWQFLRLAAQVLRDRDEPALRFLAAANAGRLGLRTIALRTLAPLDQSDAEVSALSRAIEALREQTLEGRVENARRALDLLGDRLHGPADLDDRFAQWAAAAGPAFVTSDGNTVFDRGELQRCGPWLDAQSEANQVARQHLAPLAPTPLVVEGLCPPALLQRAIVAFAGSAGARPRVIGIEGDLDALFDGLSLITAEDALSDSGLIVFAGVGAGERFASWLDDLGPFAPLGPVLSSSTRSTPVAPSPAQTVQAQASRLEAIAGEQRARIEHLYADRTPAYWRDRYAEALSGGEPLRILIPTTRSSTYIQHASADLAAAFERMGHTCRVLVEPDAHTRLTPPAYHDAIAEFEPDLVIAINYPRAALRDPGGRPLFPANLPLVCWIQDAMPHLFDAALGRAQGELDFVVGHLFNELYLAHGYPRERARKLAVVADAHKFAGTPADEFECEIAAATHHSEPPEAMHARLKRESSAQGPLERTLDRVFAELPALLAESSRRWTLARLRPLVERIAREELGAAPPAEAIDRLTHNYASPVADRMFRHEALTWAAGLAEERGWRFRIHGNGWDGHPTLARFAAGPLQHGEALAHSYRTSAVHLNLSTTTMTHQRVMECALAGGLPVCRLFRDALTPLWLRACREAMLRGRPTRLEADRAHYELASSPLGIRCRFMLDRLGIEEGRLDDIVVKNDRIEVLRDPVLGPTPQTDPAWLLGELDEVCFWDRDSLAALVDRAQGRPAWRRNLIGGIAARVRDASSSDWAARQIIDLAAGSLGAHATVAADVAEEIAADLAEEAAA